MANHNFEVSKKYVQEVYIQPKNTFLIPRYQRQYTWEETNIEEFWQTILSEDPVFLGTIIFNTKNKISHNTVEIIDGQQRYLTVQIFGAVLRDILLELYKENPNEEFLKNTAKGIHNSIIGQQDPYEPNSFKQYLIPGDSIKLFFDLYIQKFASDIKIEDNKVSKKPEQERVKKAYLKFKSLVQDKISSLNNIEVSQFLKKLVHEQLGKHYFAEIDIDNEDVAYEIFETVNAKGVDLSVADLIKNQIFKYIVGQDEIHIDSAKERWKEMCDNIESASLSLKEFISYYWCSKYQYVSDKKLYKEIRNQFGNNKDEWNYFLNDLVKNSNYLKLILEGDQQDLFELFNDQKEAEKAFKCIRVLRNTKAKTWIILFICLFRNLDSNDSKSKMELKLNNRWEILEKFIFTYFQILNQPGNWFFKLICDFSSEIEQGTNLNKQQTYFKEVFEKYYLKFKSVLNISEENFIEEIFKIEYKSEQKTRAIIRYMLNEFEKSIGGNDDEGYDENKVNLEHILPQDPKLWKLSKKDIRNHVNKLGNLTIISKSANGKMGNKILNDKLKYFNSSKLHLVKELTQKINDNSWEFHEIASNKNFSAIEKRQKELSIRGYRIWVLELKSKMGF